MAVAGQGNADISNSSGFTSVEVYDASNGFTAAMQSGNLVGDTVTASLSGVSSVHTSAYSSTVLSHAVNQFRNGAHGSYSVGYGYVNFVANANDVYTISGSFTNSDGRGNLYAYLYDLTNSSYLFESGQDHVGGTTLVLGGLAGNSSNTLTGNLTGVLAAGNQYQWWVQIISHAWIAPDSGAIASGSASLLISSVPEPSSVALLGIAAVGFALYRRRRK